MQPRDAHRDRAARERRGSAGTPPDMRYIALLLFRAAGTPRDAHSVRAAPRTQVAVPEHHQTPYIALLPSRAAGTPTEIALPEDAQGGAGAPPNPRYICVAAFLRFPQGRALLKADT
ncbi:hypothetical protein NDU88_002206 [Pleurodeles waltl]|uniref:Uncharacterized protein n=1 Tax=Pleurodeles waltl TaxID=8319 RepID=A0AAV7LJL4_PLEWA|nr:hypothetical protein NDU88_002206 [Pleurodeles waltl]